MSQQKNGITQKSTRPTRRARREQQSGLASMIEHAESTPATSTPAAEPSGAAATATSRLDAAERKRPQKIPTSTYLEVDTIKRLNWLVEQRRYVKSDVIGIALDALFDQMEVPAGADLDDSYVNNKR